MRILVVEDDPYLKQVLQSLFISQHFAVDTAADGEAGLQLAEAFTYDLILLDIGLPKIDGLRLCQVLRDRNVDIPILLLTGQEGTHLTATALNAGADDYLLKPFDVEELLARVQALLRRSAGTAAPRLTWEKLVLDPQRRKVLYGTTLLTLTPKEFAILELLLRDPQKSWSAEQILDHAWSATETPGEETIRFHIKSLRQKLQEAGAPKNWIKTVYGMGYQLNPIYASTEATLTHTSPSPTQLTELIAINQALREQNGRLEKRYQGLMQQQQALQAAQAQLEQQLRAYEAQWAQTQTTLSEGRPPWQALLEQGIDAIAVLDDQGHYQAVNTAACELFGVSQTELLLCSLRDFVDPELDLTSLWDQFLHQGYLYQTLQLHCADGTSPTATMLAIANFLPGQHLTLWRDIRTLFL